MGLNRTFQLTAAGAAPVAVLSGGGASASAGAGAVPAPSWSSGLSASWRLPATVVYVAAERTEVVAVRWTGATRSGSLTLTQIKGSHYPLTTPVRAAGAAIGGAWVLRDVRGSDLGTLTVATDQSTATLTLTGRAPQRLQGMREGRYQELVVSHTSS